MPSCWVFDGLLADARRGCSPSASVLFADRLGSGTVLRLQDSWISAIAIRNWSRLRTAQAGEAVPDGGLRTIRGALHLYPPGTSPRTASGERLGGMSGPPPPPTAGAGPLDRALAIARYRPRTRIPRVDSAGYFVARGRRDHTVSQSQGAQAGRCFSPPRGSSPPLPCLYKSGWYRGGSWAMGVGLHCSATRALVAWQATSLSRRGFRPIGRLVQAFAAARDDDDRDSMMPEAFSTAASWSAS
jgi:hypothetical protein